ncbi:MAG: Na/Pi cotransporter family protein [Bacteroidia bacterium]|nr:Na/Pi cotransporter family protein [Bacteroidia bacterium]
MTSTDFWKLLAGLGMFLYGMFHLEDTMKQLEGRSFKLFLQKHTKHKLSAILSGTLVTAVLQSSSIVNLMVLSFVGAGMLSMRNALSVALGANIGGTVNSWLVALIGFKIDIGSFTMPIIGIAGLGLIVFRNKKTLYQIAKFCMGFGLLFLGLDFMKESMDAMIKAFDFAPYLSYPRIVFVLIGFILTALIQTSAATVVIVLSALYVHILPIETAVAVVLGAELGATIKIVIGSIGGIAAKKRVAFGNILFNIVTSLFGFVFLVPIISLFNQVLGLQDPIFILVAFQTLINIVGVILFYFFLDGFARFLEKRFISDAQSATYFIQNIKPEMHSNSIELMEKEVGLFIYRVIHLNKEVFQIKHEEEPDNIYQRYTKEKSFFSTLTYIEKYNVIKKAEGEILLVYTNVVEEPIHHDDFKHLNQLMTATRSAMYSAKAMKDIIEDRKEFSNSVNEVKFDIYKMIRQQLSDFYCKANLILLETDQAKILLALHELKETIKQEYEQRIKNTYQEAGKTIIKEIDISTLFNASRELYASSESLIDALKIYLLDEEPVSSDATVL